MLIEHYSILFFFWFYCFSVSKSFMFFPNISVTKNAAMNFLLHFFFKCFLLLFLMNCLVDSFYVLGVLYV